MLNIKGLTITQGSQTLIANLNLRVDVVPWRRSLAHPARASPPC